KKGRVYRRLDHDAVALGGKSQDSGSYPGHNAWHVDDPIAFYFPVVPLANPIYYGLVIAFRPYGISEDPVFTSFYDKLYHFWSRIEVHIVHPHCQDIICSKMLF